MCARILDGMDKQEIFDTVVKALKKQGKPSVSHRGECVYRGPDGTKCAAGHLLPDECYTPTMEGASWNVLVYHHGDKLPKFLVDEADLIRRLQSIHDLWAREGAYVEDMPFPRERFERVAEDYHLQMPKV